MNFENTIDRSSNVPVFAEDLKPGDQVLFFRDGVTNPKYTEVLNVVVSSFGVSCTTYSNISGTCLFTHKHLVWILNKEHSLIRDTNL